MCVCAVIFTHRSLGQKSVKSILLSVPVETLALLFVAPCRIPAVVSFLEVFLLVPGISPLCSAHRLSPQLFLKWLEFNQNIHFLLHPFGARRGAAAILFHMRLIRGFLFLFFISLCRAPLVSIVTLLTVDLRAFIFKKMGADGCGLTEP